MKPTGLLKKFAKLTEVKMFEPGEKVICQHDDWHNAFGEGTHVLNVGMRLTLKDTRRFGGLQFFSFEETPKEFYFLSTGFKSLKQLN